MAYFQNNCQKGLPTYCVLYSLWLWMGILTTCLRNKFEVHVTTPVSSLACTASGKVCTKGKFHWQHKLLLPTIKDTCMSSTPRVILEKMSSETNNKIIRLAFFISNLKCLSKGKNLSVLLQTYQVHGSPLNRPAKKMFAKCTNIAPTACLEVSKNLYIQEDIWELFSDRVIQILHLTVSSQTYKINDTQYCTLRTNQPWEKEPVMTNEEMQVILYKMHWQKYFLHCWVRDKREFTFVKYMYHCKKTTK